MFHITLSLHLSFPLLIFRHPQAVQPHPAGCRSGEDGPRHAGSYQRDGLQPGCDGTQHLVMTRRPPVFILINY